MSFIKIRNFVQEASASGAYGSNGIRKKAPRPLASLVVAWEQLVIDVSVHAYVRLFAFWKLCKVWGTLRFDDHRGFIYVNRILRSRGLAAILVRTKTSGDDKSVQVLPFAISSEAYLSSADWLEVGWQLWGSVAPGARDYFLVAPSSDLGGVVYREVKYREAAAMSKKV